MSQPDWTSSTLAELAESKALVFSDGYRTRADQFASEGIPILRAADVADGILIPAHSDHIRTDFRPKIGNKTTRARDVVLTTKGTVGRAAMVPDGFPEHAYSPQLCFFRVKDTATLDAGYLYGWIRSTECRSQLFASKDLTDMAPYVNLRDLSQFRITLPPLSEQWRIAGVLSAFDDLIETNRNLACSQEALARVLASRGDDEVAVEEIAEVPQLRQRRPTGLVDHFAIPAFDNGQLPAHDLGSTILSGKYVLRQPSVLVSRLNPSTPRTWMAYPGMEEAVCSPEFVVLTGRYGVSTEEVWAVTSSDDFWKQMQSSVGGTTNSRQRVDKAAVPELIVPDVRLLSAEERAAISTLVRGAYELRVEAAELAAHRDELLPLLMSGKVRVSEVEGVA